MSAIKDGRYPVEIGGMTRHLLFDLNMLEEVQDKFGGYDKLDKVFDQSNPKMISDLKWLLTGLINEGKEEDEPELTEKQVGRMVHLGNLNELKEAIFASFAFGVNGGEQGNTDTDEENDEETSDDEGNSQSAQES